MASLRAHFAAFLIRLRVRPRLADMENLDRVRAIFDTETLPPPSDVHYRSATLGGVPGEWIEDARPTKAVEPTTLLYLHGGGFIACSAHTHRPLTGWFARNGFRVFAPDYRLAPEHPFPAAVEDAVAVWRALCSVTSGRLVVAGDSAGGNLAPAMMLSLREHGTRLPDAAALFSPALDLAGTGDSMRTNNGRDAMFRSEALAHLADAYLKGADPKTPLASPLYADPAGLPPMLIHVGEREVLRDDGVRFAERARNAGVRVELRVWPVVPHVWQFLHASVPEARHSLLAAAAFLHHVKVIDQREA